MKFSLGYLFVFINILAVTISQVLIKKGTENLDTSNGIYIFTQLLNVYIYFSIFLSVIAILSWFFALSKLTLSQAYPLLSVTFPLVLLMSSIIFDDQISSTQWIGMFIMIFGLYLITK